MSRARARLLQLLPAFALGCASLPPRGPGAGGQVDVLLAATTDVHGRLLGWDYDAAAPDTDRGLARLATVVDSLRAVAPGRVVLVDAGDLLQGNALTFVAARRDSLLPSPVIAAMNVMRYDAATIGNHEFNYGLAHLDRARAQAEFPFLAANARRVDGGAQFAAMRIVARAGVRIALIGVTTPGSMVWDRDHLRDRVVVDDIVAALPARVAAARDAGADAVVVIAHAGLDGPSSYDTTGTGLATENPMSRVLHEVPGIDVLVIGHTHRELADTTINGALVVQPRHWAGSLAVVRMRFRPAGATRQQLVSARGTVVPAAGHAEQRAVARAVQRAHEAAVRHSARVIGSTAETWRADSARLRDTPIIDLIQAVQLRASGAQLSSASAFSTAAELPAGPITVSDVARLYPYENTLRTLRITGTALRAYLEHSARYFVVVEDSTTGALRAAADPSIPGYSYDIVAGVDYTIDLARPAGSRITALTFEGRDVAPTDTFTLAVNNYRASGAGGYDMLRDAPVVERGTTEIRQLLIEDVRRRGTLQPDDVFTRNWRLMPPRRTLRVIAINDFHGALVKLPDGASGNRGGAAEMAALIHAAERECRPLCVPLLLHGGDLFQGTPASNFAFGQPVVRILDALGFAAGALGNHEFDWGQDTLRARLRELDSPVLGANVTYADGRDVPWIPDDTILTLGGVRVGIVGIADPATPRTTMPKHVWDLRFAEPAPVVRARAHSLRARGAKKVIVVAHLGGFCDRVNPDDCNGDVIELARELGGGVVDGIVSGHTHSWVNTVVNGVPVVQARSGGRAIGVMDIPLEYPPAISARIAWRPEVRPVVSDSITPDPAIAAIVHEAVEAVADRVNEVIVQNAQPLLRTGDQYALGNLIADAQRVAGRGDLAVMNNGGIRADLRAGTVRWGDLYTVQPFANRLVAVTVRGDALRRYLEGLVDGRSVRFHVSGLTIEYDSAAPPMARLRRVTMADGARLDDQRRYRIVMTDFLATGGDGVELGQGATVEELNMVDLDALVTYLHALPAGRLVMTEAVRAPRIRAVP
ncbi:MAG TPA: 5'-nucleotidase C-terminal domain-containing protein [Gemmatimonadaceae bacterium]|nr:5'-nucleotidase C-terminal domain-containing protein [Gemmatimonadaceae bacterium]